MRILPGSEHLPRYTFGDSKGILTYGRTRINGVSAFKIPDNDYTRAQDLGYHVLKVGTAYAYVSKG